MDVMKLDTSDISTKLQASNQLMAKLVAIFANLFPRAVGTFAMSASATKTVTDTSAISTSYVVLIPTNASAATLQGSAKSLYVTYTSGSFTVSTASGAAAAGTETFQYVLFNPV